MLAMLKVYCCFFFLGILVPTTHHELLNKFYPWKSCIVILLTAVRGVLFKVKFLQNIFSWFKNVNRVTGMFYICFFQIFFANILQKNLEHFSHSSSLLILAQIFAPFDCLHFSCGSLYWKFSVIDLNSCLKFPVNFLVSRFRSILIEGAGFRKWRSMFF